jgi:PAS domain S-box-containing protein
VDFFARLFDTSDFPPRWHCGAWTAGHGWLHIVSDLGVWSAYLAIPCVLGFFILRRKDLPFPAIFWLFGAFILACGTTHLMEAMIFWWPAYRLAGVIKLVTAIVSWGTVFALVPVVPKALAMRSPEELAREIAERKRAEEELKRQKERVGVQLAELEQIYYHAPVGLCFVDRNLRYVRINERLAEINGTTVAGHLGRSIREIIPEIADLVEPLHIRAIASGEPILDHEVHGTTAAEPGLHRDWLANYFPLKAEDETVVGVSVAIVEITLLKQTQQELLRQKEILQSIFDHIPLMVRFRDFEGRIQFVNRHWEDVMGWTLEEAQNRDIWAELYPDPEDRRQALEFARQSTGKWTDAKVTVRDGRMVDISWASIRLSDGTTIGIAQDATDRKLEEQKREAYASRLQALSRRLVVVQEQERRHLARELHDEIGQMLTSLVLLLQPRENLPTDGFGVRCQQAREIVDDLLTRIRDLSSDLRPAALDHLGLVPALLTLFERYTAQSEVRVHFKHRQMEQRFAADVETTAYRIVQEALTNVARHSGVKDVIVRAWTTSDVLSLQFEDRGRGFDPDVARATAGSSGLAGMQERVKLLDGHLTIEAGPGLGTQITAGLPLQRTFRSDNNDDFELIGRRPSGQASWHVGASGI